ncbi:MAG TPA: Gfo/Idh/MocA family oxidoreductase [Stellaceae bacterium]|jgi:predicted dehydrogenase|nr:Gfo/Idh/MocA family oxidoreductase [Stellaceae bacterium]
MKIGLVGCGKQAVKHIGGLRKCPEAELVLADKEVSRARELGRKEGLAWVERADELFADPEITAIDLCVPIPFHAEMIRRCLAGGKDFFCEKPSCENAAQARELSRLAERSRCIGMVGYVYRFAPVFQRARAILAGAGETRRSPVLGALEVASMRIGGRGSAALWKHRRSEGGGALNEMLVHMLELAIWYFGPIDRAELMISELLRPQRVIDGRLENADAEDFVLARFWTKTGLPVVIQADLVSPAFTQFLEVHGDNGSLMVSIQPEMPQFVVTRQPSGGYPAGRTELGTGAVNLFEAQMADFVAAVRDRGAHAGATLADSVRVMDAVEMLRPALAR